MKSVFTKNALLTLLCLSSVSAFADSATATDSTPAGSNSFEARHQAFIQQADESRARMEAMQEESFKAYIESLKNYPPAKQLPEAVQQRRASMIKKMEEQHELAMKMRKQRQEAFEKRRQAYEEKMHKI